MWLAIEYVGTFAHFLKALLSDLETGPASEQHCLHFTFSAIAAIGFTRSEF